MTDFNSEAQAIILDRSDAAGKTREDLWRQSILDFAQMVVDATGEWKPIGPAGATTSFGEGQVSGIIATLTIDPTPAAAVGPPRIYVGSGEGGLWFPDFIHGGYSPLTDSVPFFCVGALTVVPTADPLKPVLFLGTGNRVSMGNLPGFTRGGGLYRSFDGGITWAALDGGAQATVFAGRAINGILVFSTTKFLVATSDHLFVTNDGGLSFSAVMPGNVTELVQDTDTVNNPNVVYACVSGVGLMKSTDSGATWINLFEQRPNLTKAGFDTVDFAQADSNNYYVSLEKPGLFVGLYHWIEAARAWAKLSAFNNLIKGTEEATQSNYDFTLGVDPLASNCIYIGLIELWLSTDSGASFSDVSAANMIDNPPKMGIHPDQHCLIFSPPSQRAPRPPTRVYVGSDGGLAYSDDAGQSWTTPNGGLATNLVFSIGIGGAYAYAGMQDDGTSVSQSPYSAWTTNLSGDGGNIAVDPADPQIAYVFATGALCRTIDGGANWRGVGELPNNLSTFPYRCVALGPVNPGGSPQSDRVLYVSVEKDLYLSQKSGADLQTPDGKAPPSWKSFLSYVTAIATTELDDKRIWVGLWDGSVHLSVDGGGSFDQVLQPGNMPVNAIAIDEADKTTLPRVAVCLGNFSSRSPSIRTRHVYLTTDNGTTWKDASGTDGGDRTTNLPDAPAYDVVFDPSTHGPLSPSRLIVALDGGVAHSLDDGKTWKRLGIGLPRVACMALAIDASARPDPVLRVATWGRSCYDLHITRRDFITPQAAIRIGSNSLGFGAVLLNQPSVLSVDIYNIGNMALTIDSFTVGSGSNAFTVAATGSPGPVPPLGMTTYAVTFTPAALGDVSATLQIACSDPDNSTVNINVSGTGVAAGPPPHLTLLPNHLGFGTVKRNASADSTIKLLNTGYSDLTVTGISKIEGSSDFSVTSAIRSPLHPGESEDVTVHFAPTIAFEPGAGRTAKFKVNCNDPYNTLAAIDSDSNDPKAVGVFSVSGTADIGISWLVIGLAVLGTATLGGVIALKATKLI